MQPREMNSVSKAGFRRREPSYRCEPRACTTYGSGAISGRGGGLPSRAAVLETHDPVAEYARSALVFQSQAYSRFFFCSPGLYRRALSNRLNYNPIREGNYSRDTTG